MTAQPAAAPRTRSRLRTALAALLVLLAVSGWLFMACGDDWKSSIYAFESGAADDYRVRLTGTYGGECAKLERETTTDRYANWREAGRDCAWPRVAGGDGWLAGGNAEQLYSERRSRRTGDWIFFGIVPAAAAEVEITLATGPPHRIATRAGGKHRIYAVLLPGLGASAEVTAVRLRDARGGELRVY
jgi:hypothetical protein